MSFLTHFTVFVLVVHGISNVASHRVETPGLDQRAPETSGERRGESTRNARGDSAGTPQLVESERNIRGYDQRLIHGTRSKRGAFIVDGTKWCGLGNTADNYDDLGVHRETDICCRDHDHCPEHIAGLSRGHGLFNSLLYSISLCSCDESFRLCLRAANTSVAAEVGQFFFDTLHPSCFELSDELTPRCVRRHWFGLCREYGQPERTAVVGTNKHFNGEEYEEYEEYEEDEEDEEDEYED